MDTVLVMTDKACPGSGKSWTVDIEGKPICPRCRRSLATVAGKGRKIKDLPQVPAASDKPSRGHHQELPPLELIRSGTVRPPY